MNQEGAVSSLSAVEQPISRCASPPLGFGRSIASAKEAPIILVNLV
jgi:hypothetical protein